MKSGHFVIDILIPKLITPIKFFNMVLDFSRERDFYFLCSSLIFLNDLLNSKLYYQLHGLGLVFCWNMLDVILCYCLILQVYYILSIYYFVMIVGVLLLDISQFCNYNSIYLYGLSHISLLTTLW